MRATIYAPATLVGRSGVSVIRVSGPETAAALAALLRGGSLPPPRRASLRRLSAPQSDRALDEAIVLWLPGPGSFTGEDMAELQLHGGRAVAEAVLRALSALPGLRLAEPGEFARRAFEAGRMDLAEIEGLADLIAAETEAQRRQALHQMDGALGRLVEGWRERLVGALAHLEALIDFPEEDLPAGIESRIAEEVANLGAEIEAHLADRRGERLRAGFSVAILGAPNTGKSSLLNWLARRDAAIVAATAGTTRDVIEVEMDMAGYPVSLADTAGLRQTADLVEEEGVRRALARAERADLKLVLFKAGAPAEPASLALLDARAVAFVNMTDLSPAGGPDLPGSVRGSIKTGEGLDRLLAVIEDRIQAGLGGGAAAPLITRERHRQALEEAAAELARAASEPAPELRAESLRLAARALGRVTGRVDIEELLDRIFAEFCIGK